MYSRTLSQVGLFFDFQLYFAFKEVYLFLCQMILGCVNSRFPFSCCSILVKYVASLYGMKKQPTEVEDPWNMETQGAWNV